MFTGVPEKEALLQNGEKHKVTVHGAPRGQKTYIQWGAAWFLKGIFYDTAVTHYPCVIQPSARYPPPWPG
jgi:hypothetical protein